ncbi:MAG: hypothetical protein AAF721_22305 [Myxococcota bacterium]
MKYVPTIAIALCLAPACDPDPDPEPVAGTGTSTGSTPMESSGGTPQSDTSGMAESTAAADEDSGSSSDTGGVASSSEGTDGGSTTDGTDSGSSGSSGGMMGEACFEGGTPAPPPTGSGTCADPYVIDLSMEAHGTIVTHDLTGGADEMDLGGGCDDPPTGTARDVVYHVMMPDDVMELQLSVDAADGADPRLAVAEDPSCFQPMNACATVGGVGACEGLVAPRGGAGFFGVSTYAVVSELADSGADLVVRFATAG